MIFASHNALFSLLSNAHGTSAIWSSDKNAPRQPCDIVLGTDRKFESVTIVVNVFQTQRSADLIPTRLPNQFTSVFSTSYGVFFVDDWVGRGGTGDTRLRLVKRACSGRTRTVIIIIIIIFLFPYGFRKTKEIKQTNKQIKEQ
uniref:Uncharacterized protein n=1 Tax=Sipha flava TaxID=143950 RepID=A0A2S2PXK9_9HEMI